MPTSILQRLSQEFPQMISNIANLLFEHSWFSTEMKIGLVTPLLKKPGLVTDDYKNFHRITNLPTVWKILEQIILHRLRPQLESSLIFCKLQSAYRSGWAIETALMKVIDDILSHIDTGSVVTLIIRDILSAFDTTEWIVDVATVWVWSVWQCDIISQAQLTMPIK